MRGKRNIGRTWKAKRTLTAVVGILVVAAGFTGLAPMVSAAACPAGTDIDEGGHGEDYPFHICIDIVDRFLTAKKVQFNCTPWPQCIGEPPTPPDPPLPQNPGTPPSPGAPPSPGPYAPPPDPGTPDNDNCLFGGEVCHPSVSSVLNWTGAAVVAAQAWADSTKGQASSDASEAHSYTTGEAGRYSCWAMCNQPDYLTYTEAYANAFQSWADAAVNSVSVTDDTVTYKWVLVHEATLNVEEWLLNEACEAVKGENADPEDCVQDIQDLIDQIEEEVNRIVNDILRNLPDDLIIGTASASDGTMGLVVQFDDQAFYLPVSAGA